MQKLNLVGQKFGKLTVKKEAEKKNTSIRWHCDCDCGGTSISSTVNLRNGISKSCGCISKQRMISINKESAVHNMRKSPVYQMWKSMFKRYSVSEKWSYTKEGGGNFEKWVFSKGWKKGNKYTVSKIFKNLKIGPNNCKLILKTPDLTGKKFHYLTVIGKSNKKGNVTYWDCKCKCGNLTQAGTRALLKKVKQSCGCYKIEVCTQICKDRSVHGLKEHPIYSIWMGMRNRCKDKTNKYYGVKGISVCNKWENDVVAFFNWMVENNWKSGMCIHRKDVNGNYNPNNCILMTKSEHSTYHNNIRFGNI